MILFLDFDGTITPIVSRPDQAVLTDESRNTLSRLNAAPDVHLAIVSGRSIADLKERVGLPLIFAGNHGLEIEGPGVAYRHSPALDLAPRLPELLDRVRSVLSEVPEILFELKELTASVHYRQVPSGLWPWLVQTVEEIVAQNGSGFVTRNGKRVVEIRPAVEWNKGRAALWILDHLGKSNEPVICMGDDETDEDLFRLLPEAVSYRVGHSDETAAKHIIANPEEALRILQSLIPNGR